MTDSFSRTRLLLGGESMQLLSRARVAVFGIGGVGGYVCEALARSGVGALDLIDGDTVSQTNINRQIIATHSTIGKYKCEVMKERVLDINPAAEVTACPRFFLPENADEFDFHRYDYIVDAVDNVPAKIALVMKARESGVPVISCLSAGNKLDPTLFRVADLYDTKMCPLAKILRRELRKRGVERLKVVYSEEEPLRPTYVEPNGGESTPCPPPQSVTEKRNPPGSVAFVPSVAGLITAGEVIKDLIKPSPVA